VFLSGCGALRKPGTLLGECTLLTCDASCHLEGSHTRHTPPPILTLLVHTPCGLTLPLPSPMQQLLPTPLPSLCTCALHCRFKLPPVDTMPLSRMFSVFEEQKPVLRIIEYALSQTSLEQIFNSFAALQVVCAGAGRRVECQSGGPPCCLALGASPLTCVF